MEARPARTRAPETRPEQLLDAAEAVFLDRGFARATIADIAQRARLAKGTVYLYFESKQALVEALRRRYIDDIDAAVQSALAGEDRFEDQLSAAVTALVNAATKRTDLHRLLFHEAGFSEEDAFASLRGTLVEFITKKHPGVKPVAVAFLVGGLHNAIVDVGHAPRAQRAAMTKEIARLSLRVVQPPSKEG